MSENRRVVRLGQDDGRKNCGGGTNPEMARQERFGKEVVGLRSRFPRARWVSESGCLDTGVGSWSSNDSRRDKLGRMVANSTNTGSRSISPMGPGVAGCEGPA